MDNVEQYKQALIKAHNAGDFEAAELFASKIKAIQNPSVRSRANKVLNQALAEPEGERSMLQRATVDPLRRAARHAVGAGQELMTDPMSALRGAAGVTGDVVESIGKFPGALGIGVVEGATSGSPLRALEEFRTSFESELPGGVGGLSRNPQVQQSPTYQAGAALLNQGDEAALAMQQGFTGLAQGGIDLMSGRLPFDPATPTSGLAKELGALGNIGVGVGAAFIPSVLPKKPGGGPAVAPTAADQEAFRAHTDNNVSRIMTQDAESAMREGMGRDAARASWEAGIADLEAQVRAKVDAEKNQNLRGLGILDEPEMFPETLRSDIPTIDPARMVPDDSAGGLRQVDVQPDLFDNPVRPPDRGLEPMSGRRGSDINATVERLRNGEFVETPVRQRTPVRYKGLPDNVVAFASMDQNFSNGLDYWMSRLDDQNLIYDKAQFDNHTRKDLQDIGQLLKEINEKDKARKDALVELSDPNEFSSLEGDKEFRFRQINDAIEAEIQPLVARLDDIWGRVQGRMERRENAPKTRQIYSTDSNTPQRAGALTVQKTERPNLGAPEGQRDPYTPRPFNEYASLEGDGGSKLSLVDEPPVNRADTQPTSSLDAASPLGDKLTDSFRAGDIRGSLIHIAASGTAFERKVAAFFLQNLDKLGDLKLRWLPDMSPDALANYNRNRHYDDKITDPNKPQALYAANVHTIVLGNVPPSQMSRLFLHEMTHAFTHGYVQRAMDNLPGNWAGSPMAAAAARRIVDLYENVKKSNPELARLYGMKDANEFVAEAFSNPKFRDELAKVYINAKTAPYQKLVKSAWTNFVQSVAGLLRNLGLDINIQRPDQFSALSELLNEGSRVIERGTAADRTMYKSTNTKKDLVFGKLQSAAKSGNLAATAARMRDEFVLDERPVNQVISDLGITPENVREKMPDVSMGFVRGTKFTVDRAISILAQRAGPVHDLIKNIIDRQQQIERDMRAGMENFTLGPNWRTGKFGMEVKKTEGGILAALRKDQISIPQAMLMKKTWLDNVAGPRDLTKADFGTEAQWKAFSTIQANLKKMWDETNEMRERIGLSTVPYIRNYFPSQWEGDYRVFIRNSTGELIDVRGAPSRRQARKLAAELEKEAIKQGKVDFSFTADLASKSVRDVADLSMMDDVMRALQNHPQAHEAMQKVYAQVAAKRGFGSTALQRKGVFGALGYEEGELGLRRMQKSLETYINRQQTYVANIKRQMLKNELANMDRKIQQAIPHALKVMHDYLDHTKGKTEHNFIDGVAEAFGEAIGQGDGMAIRGIHRASRAASFMVLSTLNFLSSQIVQPTYAFAQLLKMKALGQMNQSATMAFFQGYSNYIRALSGDPENRQAVNWARKNGFIEPALLAVMNDHIRDSAFRTENKISTAADKAFSSFGVVSGGLEEWSVRMPTFFIFEQALRDSIKDPVTRYKEAGARTDYYMVHYSQEALPMMYTQMGKTIGETAKPLKQFAHQYYGMFLEYLNFMAEGKDFKSTLPLVGFMTSSMILGGASSFVGAEAINAFLALLNLIMEKGFGKDKTERIPDIKDLVASTNFGDKFTNDLATFGAPAAITRTNISGALSAPQLEQFMQLPLSISFWGATVTDTLNYLGKYFSGTATEADEMRMLISASPIALRGSIEQLYSPDGSIVPNPRDDMRPFYRRDETERWRAFAGLRSTDEARYRQLVSAAKMLVFAEREKRMVIMDKMYNDILQGKTIDQKLIDSYISAGGDPRSLTSNIRQRLMDQDDTWAERQMQRRPTASSINDRAAVQKFMENPSP
jgi:hypothetical protein